MLRESRTSVVVTRKANETDTVRGLSTKLDERIYSGIMDSRQEGEERDFRRRQRDPN